MRNFLLLLAALVVPAFAQTSKTSTWEGFERVDFTLGTRAALVVKPKSAAEGRPWIWRTEFFGHQPQADIALLGLGWHVAYINVKDMYGAPPAIAAMADFHAHVVKEFGLNQRAVLEGFSRGGLYAVNFAEAHPSKTAALYLDAPVLDLRSWPGGHGKGKGAPAEWKKALGIYGVTEAAAKDFPGNPLNHAESLAKVKIPIIAVCGADDDVVPMEENINPFAQRYKAAGGMIQVVAKPGVKHHPHSLEDPKPIVDFLVRHAAAIQPGQAVIRFMSYDINPKNPKDVTIGIHANGRSHFKSLGETIPGTNYKFEAFEKKVAPRPDGTTNDTSEIVLLDTNTNQTTVVALSQVVDLPAKQ